MADKQDGGSAFPFWSHGPPGDEIARGMSLRDWFAGMAMQASASLRDPKTGTIGDYAASCYRVADAMLAAREATEAAGGDDDKDS